MRLVYFYFPEARIIYGSAASMALQGHEVYVIEPADFTRPPFEEATMDVEIGIDGATRQVQLNILRVATQFLPQALIPIFHTCSPQVMELVSAIDPDALIASYHYWTIAQKIAKHLKKPLILWHLVTPRMFNLPAYWRARSYSQILSAPLGLVHNVWLAYSSDYVLTNELRTSRIFKRFGVQKVKTIWPTYTKFVGKGEYARFLQGSGSSLALNDLPSRYVLSMVILSKDDSLYRYQLQRLNYFCEVAERAPSIDFVAIGVSVNDIKGAFRYEGLGNLSLIGKVYNDKVMAELYRKAHCVLCPIFDAAFTNRFFEAFFYGKVVISTAIANKCYEGLHHGTNILLSDSITTAAEYVRKIVTEDEFRLKLEENARNYYLDYFSPEKHAKELEYVLDSLRH